MNKLIILLFFGVFLYANDALVSSQWLHKNLTNKNIRIVEISNLESYSKHHITGSVFTDIDKWRVNNGIFLTLRPLEEIEKEISALGIDQDTHVVIYAPIKHPKDYLKASYLYWAMDYVGIKKVSLLDGGLNKWIEEGFKTTTKTTHVNSTNFKANPDQSKLADLKYVQEQLGTMPMIDARPADKYLGITPTATVKRDGHIKGAMSYSWNYSINNDYTLKSKKLLDQLFSDGYKLDKDKEVLVYCTGGLETSFNYFLLSGVLGYKNVRLYDASMKEWGNREDTQMTQFKYEMFDPNL